MGDCLTSALLYSYLIRDFGKTVFHRVLFFVISLLRKCEKRAVNFAIQTFVTLPFFFKMCKLLMPAQNLYKSKD